ncbi:hypothetical protein HA402_002648 [Bradysia odoriphaga]|nr:hypothetical protein HA402_002648 [Bradysia odoriphaga]
MHLKVNTIIITLLLVGTALSLPEKTNSSIKSKISMLRNLALYAENEAVTQDTTCTDDLNEILRYLEIGLEDIETTDVKDVVMLIGATGVGKSTLAQFIANETNTLRAQCVFGDCKIIDDSGTIGDSIISKTFLPNLVFHDSFQIPFYDMPGFNDNRNESIEIAISFFMRQILEEAETIKIVVLANFASFRTNSKTDFANLLRNLVDLIKEPAKFRGGMAIVSTIVPVGITHLEIIGRNTHFLHEELLPEIDSLFGGDERYVRGSTEILENWLESDTGNYYDANYYSYFLTPGIEGPLLENPLLATNKEFLNDVIWNRLQFMPTQPDDFGLSMSRAALYKLEKIGVCISHNLYGHMQTFSKNVENYMLDELTDVIDVKETDTKHISELLTNLTSLDFSFDNNQPQEPLTVYLENLLHAVNKLETPFLRETRQVLEDTLAFIHFILLTDTSFQFEPSLWVNDIQKIQTNLIEKFYVRTNELLANAVSSLEKESEIIAAILFTRIESLKDISLKVNQVSSVLTTISDMFNRIDAKERSPGVGVSDLLRFFASEYDTVRDCNKCPSCSTIPELEALSVLGILDDFSWYSRNWTSVGVVLLRKPFEIEKDLTVFLRALFEDLSQPAIQTGNVSDIYIWWNTDKHLSENNFRDFHRIIYTQRFTSGNLFSEDYLKELIFYTTKGMHRVEFLLGYMLKKVDCPTTNELVFTGAIISFDRIAHCYRKDQTTSIVLLATSRIHANSKIIGNEINRNSNINVILMSPEIIVSQNSEIDLSGYAGQQDVAGKPAGTQYSLYQRISTTDSTIPSRIVFPNLSGGPGVDGAVGITGEIGKQGDIYFNAESELYCKAWSNGAIQIVRYTNTCNSCLRLNCVCYTSSYGVLIVIEGSSGSQGGVGGPGKSGSCGGAGGQSYSVDANHFLLPKTATNGLQGKNGVGGPGGPGGLGGLYGDTLSVLVKGYYRWSDFAYFCWEIFRVTKSSTLRAADGFTGQSGQSCTTTVPRKTVNRIVVNNHFASFKAALGQQVENEFLHLQTTLLLKLFGNASAL